MDFNSLQPNSFIYVLRTKPTPTLQIGKVKNRTNQKSKPPKGSNGLSYYGSNGILVEDFTVNFDGKDEIFTEVPLTADISQTDDEATFLAVSNSTMATVVQHLISQSKKALSEDSIRYHETMVSEGEKIYETLNPQYADEKRQAKTIADLEKGYSALTQQINKLGADNAKILQLLSKLTNEGKSAKN